MTTEKILYLSLDYSNLGRLLTKRIRIRFLKYLLPIPILNELHKRIDLLGYSYMVIRA